MKITSLSIFTDKKSVSVRVKPSQKTPLQLIVIDSSVKDYASLIDALKPEISVAFLDRDRNGIQQLTEILSKYNNLAALNIVTHGSSGTLHLGNTHLNLNNINNYLPQLHSWRKALKENADICLYSCEIGKDSNTFVSRLHQILGINVAASSQKVGNPQLGGTWNLDIILGKIRTQFPFNRAKLAAYPGVLATFNVAAGDVAGLKSAIAAANATLADDIIELTAGSYTLTAVDNNAPDTTPNGLPTLATTAIGGKLTVNGNGATIQRDTTAPAFRFFYVPSGTDLTLNTLTLQNGQGTYKGGAIFHDQGKLTINNSTFTNNLVTGDNNASGGGGALFVSFGNPVNINNSTFSGNSAQGFGGAIGNQGTINILNSTITNNIANSNNNAPSATEDVGGGIFHTAGTIALKNTIVAKNYRSTTANSDDLYKVTPSSATWTNGGSNLIGNNATATTDFPASTLIGTAGSPVDPKLEVLADNGGLTKTHALLSGSPALDGGNNTNAAALTTDQRGFIRVYNTTVDIGALEYSGAVITSVAVPAAKAYKAGENLDFTVTFNEPVTINPATASVNLPLILNTGGKVNATLLGAGTAPKSYVFRYTVANGNEDNDGIVLDPALTLNAGATIVDGMNGNANLTLLNVGSTTGVNVDAVLPTISSITRQNPTTATTNASSVVYQVNFSEAVQGLDVSDFTLNKTGSVLGTIASVSAAAGNSVTVTVDGISGDGTLRLDTAATPTIQDNAGNSLTTAFTTGETYTFIEKIPPAITKITRQNPLSATTNASSVVYQVDFSEAVQGLDVSDFTLNKTGSVLGTIASVSAAAGNSVTVTVNGISGDGTLRLDTAATPTIQDNAGNNLTAPFNTGETYTLATPPTITKIARQNPLSATTNASSVVYQVDFSEAVQGLDVSDFTLNKTGSVLGTIASVSAAAGIA